MAAAEAQPLPAGSGSFILPNEGVPIEVFTYRPPTYDGGPLVVVVHGSDRNAEDYRNYAISIAERCEVLIAAPLFDLKRFPDTLYKRGGGVLLDGKAQPREAWTYNVIFRLVAEIRRRQARPDLPYVMLGHSGGGQFVSKMALFMPGDAVRFVAANPGSYVFPTSEAAFPYGLGGLPPELSSEEALRRYCAAPLVLYLGTGDVYQNASDGFDSSPAALRQGPVRLARGHNFFSTMRQLAADHHWAFNWRLVETPDIGHSGSQMFHAREIEDALFGPVQASPTK
jgi:poly(3-hydroxybutyrate) depolymerase